MLEQYIIRKAKIDEVPILQNIMRRSLSTWDYPEEELSIIREHLTITTEMVARSIVYVAELHSEIKGFWGIEPKEELSEAKFYLDPTIFRTGVGTMLWNKMLVDLKNRNMKYITFLSEMNAQGFYEKLGAIRIGYKPSTIITGENIPIMRYYLNADG